MEIESVHLAPFLNSSLLLQTSFSAEVIIALVLVLLLLLGSSMISGSEVAFFSLTPNDINKLQDENSRAGKRIIRLKEAPRTLLATILIGNNFINIGIVLLSDFILKKVIPPETCDAWAHAIQQLFNFNLIDLNSLSNTIHLTITVFGVTFLLVLFGEIAPKIYAKLNKVQLAKNMSGLLSILMPLFSPLSRILVKWTNIVEKKISAQTSASSTTSKAEIGEAIELTVSHEKNAIRDINILKGIVKFGDVTVKQIMRSRVDVVALDITTSFKDLLKVAKDSGYSRIPVYENDFDNVAGILYVKDLLGHIQEPDDFEWQKLIRTNVLYVPELKKINELLKEFQSQRMHMALVVDEYGGSSGIVTLEDVMEEVIGEIRDEFDSQMEVDYHKVDDYTYIFEGKTLLNDVCRVIGVETDTFDEIRGDADSVAGLVLEALGYLPEINKEIMYNDYSFKVVSVSRRRIEKIKLTLPNKKKKSV